MPSSNNAAAISSRGSLEIARQKTESSGRYHSHNSDGAAAQQQQPTNLRGVTKPSREERKLAKKKAKKALIVAQRQADKAAAAQAATIDVHHVEQGLVHHVEQGLHQSKHVERAMTSSEEYEPGVSYMVTTKEKFADRIIAIPEIVQREVNEQAFVGVTRKVVEREQIIVVKETVEIPEIEYIDEYITEIYDQDVHRTIEKPITVEREVDHVIHIDDLETVVVEVPEVTYDDVIVVKDVHVPTIVEKEIIIEKIVPQIKEEIIENLHYVYQDREIKRNIPVPVEATIKQRFIAPRIEPVHQHGTYQVLLPEFQEHAVYASVLTENGRKMLPEFNIRINQLAGSSLCEVEKLFTDLKNTADMETQDWLDLDLFKGKMDLPFMGVEKVSYKPPVFIKSNTVVHPVTHETVRTANVSGKKNRKNNLCKPKIEARSGLDLASDADDSPQQTRAQIFIQVDSGYNGRTMLNPSVSYARKSIINV